MSKKKIALIITGAVILIAFVLFTRTGYWTALIKSMGSFAESTRDRRVLYEPGAEEQAYKIAAYLQTAVNIVEEKQFNPFIRDFRVYVCNSQKSFAEYTASNPSYPIRGTVLTGDIYIAPGAFNFEGRDTHEESLKHELSHLHFRQRLGFFKDRKIPVWFKEGLADHVSGAGGEGVEESDAIEMILNEKHFIPEEEGKIFGSFAGAMNNLSGPVFHMQVKMFTKFLAESFPLNLKSLVQKLLEGEPFNESFKETMNSDVKAVWEKFESHLREKKRFLKDWEG